jgi:hypothetical protein
MDTLRLASHGLSKHDQDLLSKQLKMLKGRTACEWIVIEDYRSADVTLVQGQPPSDITGVIALAGTQAGKRGQHYLIEWPIRLFGLIDLLIAVEAERASRPVVPGRSLSMAYQLSQIKSDQWLSVEEVVLQVSFTRDEVKASQSEFSRLVDRLSVLNEQSARLVQRAAVGPSTVLEPYSLKALIWSLALRDDTIKPRQWHITQQQFRLATWPLFGSWETAPWMLRLAALYGRQPATLAEGVELTGLRVEQVAAFLHACELCQLGVAIKQTAAVIPRVESRPPAPASLLARVRRKLGLGYKRAP